jgi:hypothetical protein
MVNNNYKQFTRGDIIFEVCYSRDGRNRYSQPYVVRYLGGGLCIYVADTNYIASVGPLFDAKHDIFVFSNTKYTNAERNEICVESVIQCSSRYDHRNIRRKVWDAVIRKKYFHDPGDKFLCAEFVNDIEGKVVKKIVNKRFPTPIEVFDKLMLNDDWVLPYSFRSDYFIGAEPVDVEDYTKFKKYIRV